MTYTEFSQRVVFQHVINHPRSATEVFLSVEDMPPKKNLTRAQRERRRVVARMLENLAVEGAIDVVPHTEYKMPAFVSKPLGSRAAAPYR